MVDAQYDNKPDGRLIYLHLVARSYKRPGDASNKGLSGKTHLEMMKAKTCLALPFSALLNCRY